MQPHGRGGFARWRRRQGAPTGDAVPGTFEALLRTAALASVKEGMEPMDESGQNRRQDARKADTASISSKGEMRRAVGKCRLAASGFGRSQAVRILWPYGGQLFDANWCRHSKRKHSPMASGMFRRRQNEPPLVQGKATSAFFTAGIRIFGSAGVVLRGQLGALGCPGCA